MARVVIRTLDEYSESDVSVIPQFVISGSVKSRAIITSPDRPIFLWMHDAPAGAALRWTSPSVGHGIFLLKGGVEIEGTTLNAGGAVLIERLGECTAVAGSSGVALLHFHQQTPHEALLSRPGGRTHVGGVDGAYQVELASGGIGTIWADSSCPTCDLWFQKSELRGPRKQGLPHYHTANEIIYLLDGEMHVGRRVLLPGTALAIDANTPYGFGTGEEGLSFILFRPGEPAYVRKFPDGSYVKYNERDYIKSPATAKGTPVTQGN